MTLTDTLHVQLEVGWVNHCQQYLGGSESLIDGFSGFDSGSVDAPVEEEHDEHRDEERTEGRVDDVTGVVGQFTRPVVAIVLASNGRLSFVDFAVIPSDQRRETDDERQRPHDGQEDFGSCW